MKIVSITKPEVLSVQIQENNGTTSLYEYLVHSKRWLKTHPYIDCLVPDDIQIKLDKLLEEYYEQKGDK